MLGEPECVAIGVVDVKLPRAPTLINRPFMDVLGSIRIPGRAQPSLAKLAEDCINVIGRNDNHLTQLPVTTVAGEEESIAVARQRAAGRICEIVVSLHAHEIEHASVERQRRSHVLTADSCENCHMLPNALRLSCEGVRRQLRSPAGQIYRAAADALTPSSAPSAG